MQLLIKFTHLFTKNLQCICRRHVCISNKRENQDDIEGKCDHVTFLENQHESVKEKSTKIFANIVRIITVGAIIGLNRPPKLARQLGLEFAVKRSPI